MPVNISAQTVNIYTQTTSSAGATYRPYISIDVFDKGPSGMPQIHELLDLPDSFFSNYMEVVESDESDDNAVFYQHSGYGKGSKPNLCPFWISNLGEGVAYRLSAVGIKRYVHEPGLLQNDQGKRLFWCVENNIIILPTCRELPVHKKDGKDVNSDASYAYPNSRWVPICVDLGPDADDDIEVEFFDINNVHYKQRFFRIKNTATPTKYEKKVCRYRSDHPVIVHQNEG